MWELAIIYCTCHLPVHTTILYTVARISNLKSVLHVCGLDIQYYYSFKIFPRFWLVKTTRIIHHKQLLLTKNSVILNQWRQKCSPPLIIESLTSKVQSAADYWIIDVKDYWTIDRENLGTRLCHSAKREMAVSIVYKFERRKYFEWIIKQLLNSAFVGYEEFCGSRRVLSTSAFGLGG